MTSYEAKSILKKYTYDYEKWCDIVFNNKWGEDVPTGIEGPIAAHLANVANIKITGELNPDVYYVFRWTKAHDKLVPARVSMSLKTKANIEQGSLKFGLLSILNEI